MSDDLSDMIARRDALLKTIEGRRQCSGKVADCAHATGIVRERNFYRMEEFGAWKVSKFCDRCLRKSTSINPTAEQKAACVVFDPAKVEAIRSERKQESAEYSSLMRRIYEMEKEAKDNDFWTRYHAHIASDAWKAKRRAVIQRCNNVCEGCMSAEVGHVHHQTYEHLGDELLFELVGLCIACHIKCHPDRFGDGEVF